MCIAKEKKSEYKEIFCVRCIFKSIQKQYKAKQTKILLHDRLFKDQYRKFLDKK